ncbi:MAG: hypothetical protein P8Y39_05840 [Nitrospirota bacterium]
MNVPNEDVRGVVVEVPPGHEHVRTTVLLADGTELTFQEATVSNLVRAFLTVKTHPRRTRVVLSGKHLAERKKGYAPWQLLEDQSSEDQSPEDQGDQSPSKEDEPGKGRSFESPSEGEY